MWKCRLDIKYSVQIKLGELNHCCVTWCVNRIHAGNTKATTTHSWSTKVRFIPSSWIRKNRDAYTAKLILEGAKSTQAWALHSVAKGPGACTVLHQAVLPHLQILLSPFPHLYGGPSLWERLLKVFHNILLYFVRKFCFFSVDRQHTRANINMSIFSAREFANISLVPSWSLRENNSKSNSFFSLLTSLPLFNPFLSTHGMAMLGKTVFSLGFLWHLLFKINR